MIFFKSTRFTYISTHTFDLTPREITPFPTVFKRLVLQAHKKHRLVRNRNKLLPSLLFVSPLILNNLCNFEVKISSVLTEILQNVKVLSCDQRSDNTCTILFSLSIFHMRSRACIKNILCLVLQICLHLEASDCTTTSDWINHML